MGAADTGWPDSPSVRNDFARSALARWSGYDPLRVTALYTPRYSLFRRLNADQVPVVIYIPNPDRNCGIINPSSPIMRIGLWEDIFERMSVNS